MSEHSVDGKRVALASFPRSGNTWLRYMVEEATGILSGSIYRDKILQRGSEGVVIKTHDLDAFRYTHAIHLIRNPFDAILSYFHYKRDFKGKDIEWTKHVKESVERWHLHTEHWLAVNIPVFQLRYEDLLTDPKKRLAEVLLWRGFDISENNIANVVSQARLENMRETFPEGGEKFFRQGQSFVSNTLFNKIEIELVVNRLNDFLIKFGYVPVKHHSGSGLSQSELIKCG